ncbi:nucleolysin tiar [Hordeum vulgare]|nr:nucleolysin tiar [Hordeum vulgare]
MTTEAAEVEAARNRPPPVPQLRTPAEQMAFLVSIVQGMEKNIQEIMQNQKSIERVVETKFHNMDVKVTELTTIVRQLQHEVDSLDIPCRGDEDEYEDDDDDEHESPPPTTTRNDALHLVFFPQLVSGSDNMSQCARDSL